MYSGADTLTGGFPHSEIRGSTIARISPQLIAACHVLHRLLAPRHPPNALIALNTYHQCPHAGPSPTQRSSAYQTKTQTGDSRPGKSRGDRGQAQLTHSLLFTTPPVQRRALAPHNTAGLVTNQSDSPVKQHASQVRSIADHHQAANPLCSGTHPIRRTSRPSTNQANPLETVGIEPTAPCLQSRCSTTELRPHIPGPQPNHQDKPGSPLTLPEEPSDQWWAKEDLNLRPHAYQACALTN